MKAGSSSTPIPFLLVDSSTGQTGQTGKTGSAVNTPVTLTGGVGGSITITVFKPGGTGYVDGVGTVTEMGNGVYVYQPTTTEDTSTGLLFIDVTCSGCMTVDKFAQVIGFDPTSSTNLGLSALPTVSPGASGGLVPVGGVVTVNAIAAGTTAPAGFFATASAPGSAWFANLPAVSVGGYASNEDPASILFGSTLLATTTTWTAGQYGYYLERSLGADAGNYSRNTTSGVITFTMPNGQSYTATIAVNGNGQITGRVTN